MNMQVKRAAEPCEMTASEFFAALNMIFRAKFMTSCANFQISCTHPYNFRLFWYPFIEDVIEKGASRESSEKVGGRKEEVFFSFHFLIL